MIKSFRDKRTADMFYGHRTARLRQVSSQVIRAAQRKLRTIDAAERLSDLAVPPANRLEALKGDRAGCHSVRVNDQWRLVFRWEDDGAHDVEFTDYHQ